MGVKDRVRQREKAMEMEQMFVWLLICGPIRVATQAAGIDGLLVRTGPSVRCFQND